MEDKKFTSLPSLADIGAAEAEESAKLGTVDLGLLTNVGSSSSYSSATVANSNVPTLSSGPASSLYTSPVGFNPNTRNVERYLDHPGYKRLGFSVLRDNEEHYNANTSWVGDFRRAFKLHNFGAGFAQGFTSSYQGLGTIGSGDIFNPAAMDREKGLLAEEAAARSMSTRGGFAQSAINIPYNFNYTFGIVASIAAEDLLLAAAAPETFGGSLTYAAYRTVKQGGKALKSLYSAVKTADNIKDVVKLKDVYQGTKAGVGALGQAFVPNTAKLVRDSYRTNLRTYDALGALFSARGFGAAYRDFRMVSLAVDESGVEAAGVRNQMEDKLIRQYVAANDRLPEGEAMVNIMETAREASTKDYFANLPVIYATNAITFNSLTLPHSLTGNTLRVAKAGNKHLFARAVGTGVEAEILSTAQVIGRSFTNKEMAKYALGTSMNYLKGNLAEGFQELYQEGVSASLEDYYTNKYFSGDTLFAKSFKSSVRDGIGAQISQQGLEAFLGGFLGGAGVQAAGAGLNQLRGIAAQAGGRFSSDFREQYEKRREADLKALQNMQATVLEHSENVLAALAPEFTEFQVQNDGSKMLLQAAELNDRKAFEDLKDNSLFNHIVRLSGLGVTDTFIEAMENHKLLSEEEMKQALNVESKEEGDKLVDDIVKRTRSIANLSMMINERYQNPYAGLIFDMSKEASERKSAMISYMAWEEAKKDFVYSYYKSGRNLDRLDEIYDAATSDPVIGAMMNSDFAVLFSTKSGRADKEGKRLYEQALEAEVDRLTAEISNSELELANVDASEMSDAEKADQKRVLQQRLSNATKRKELLQNYSKAISTILESNNVEETLKDPKVRQEFEDAVEKYVEFLAEGSSSLLDKSKLAKLKNQLYDYLKLSEDRVRFNSAAAALSDPSQFSRWYDVHKAQLKNAYDRYLKEGLERAKMAVEKEHRLQLIEELRDIGVVIVADDEVNEKGEVVRSSPLDRFIQLGDVPTQFLSNNEKDTDINGIVLEGTETWNEIQDIIDKYALLDEEFAQDLEAMRNKESEVEEETKAEEVTPSAPPGSVQEPPQEDEEEVAEEESQTEDPENVTATTTSDTIYNFQLLEEEFGNVLYNGRPGGLIQELQKRFRKANAERSQEDRYTDINDWINGEGKIEVEPIILRLREAVQQTTVEPVEETPDVRFEEPQESVEPESTPKPPKRKGRTLSQRLASLAKTKNIDTIQNQKDKAANELSPEESATFIEKANERIKELDKNKAPKQQEMNFEPADVEVSEEAESSKANDVIKDLEAGGSIEEEDIDLSC